MINKNYLIFAAAIALASCSVDEYMGEKPEFTQTTKENIIGFGGGTGSMSRVTQNTGTTEQMLDHQFKVYGWKTTNTGTQKVFDNYWVWYSTEATPSNPDATQGPNDGWEYVGNADTGMPFELPTTETQKDQYIKYWDYSATDYKFVAGSPISAFTFIPSSSAAADIVSATVTGLGGHIDPNPTGSPINTDPVYIAKPVIIKKDNTTSLKYGEPVQLTFTRLQTRVRVGIYETIKGYSINEIKFYKQGASGLELDQNNVVLTSSGDNFYGGTGFTATVDYDWDNANPSFSYEYLSVTGNKNWYGGQFEHGIPAISSTESDVSTLYGTDQDMDDQTGYFTVIPNNNNQAIIIKCDYTLTSDDGSNEIIKVTGATAAIPAAYCKWDENKMYTYIFKISQETNGTTGGSNDKPGLFPITFDATVKATEEGVETIVQTPSITTYQANSVTDNGIEYKTGTAIDITVTDNSTGNKKILNNNDTEGCLKVYKFTSLTDEATLQATGTTGGTDINGLSLSEENTKATFTPADAGWYAIQYCVTAANNSETPPTPAAYKYKVIHVQSGN